MTLSPSTNEGSAKESCATSASSGSDNTSKFGLQATKTAIDTSINSPDSNDIGSEREQPELSEGIKKLNV